MKNANSASKMFVISSVILLLCLIFIVNPIPLANAASGFNLTASGQTETTITLSWTKSTDVWFYKYQLWVSSTGTNGPWTNIWTSDGNSTHNTYAVTGLSPNTQYWFYVEDTGLSQDYNSNVYQVSTTPNPQLSITSRTESTASLSWSDYNTYSSLMPFQSYVVQMSTNGGAWSTLTSITDATQNTYVVTGLSPATYAFRMYDKVGTSGEYSSMSNFQTLTIYPPLQVNVPNPSTTTVDAGQQIQLTAYAGGGSGSYIYQWYVDSNPIAGAISSSFSFSSSETGTHSVKCTVRDAQDSSTAMVTSNSISLTVPTLYVNLITPTPITTQTQAPTVLPDTTQPSDNSGLFIVMFVIIIAIVGIMVAVIFMQKSSKKSKVP